MLLNCSVGEDPWQSLGLHGDQTSQPERKSVLNTHWKNWSWSWSSNTLATWCEELTHWKRLNAGKDWRQEEKGMTEDKMVGWHPWVDKFEQTPGVGDGLRSLVCCSPSGLRESDMTEQLTWTELKCFGASSRSSHRAGHCWLLYKIHFSSHITIWLRNASLLLHRIKEDNTSKQQFFWFLVSSWGTHLSSFFIFPICFKYWMTVEWSTLSFLATSHVAAGGSVLMIALNWLLSTSNDQPLCSSFSRLLSPLQNFLNQHYAVCSLAIPGPNALLMLWVVPAALWPILNSNKKNL